MKLLITEDELRLARLLEKWLADTGYEADIAETGDQAMRMAKESLYDAFVLDIMLPDLSGLDVCKKLRDRGIKAPILMLTARDSTADKIIGLDAGADDYMTKPFDFEEFGAHIRALLRKGKGYERPVFQVADLMIDPNTKTVMRGSREISLSRKEYSLLEFLARNQDRLVTRPMISHSVWENDSSAYTNIIEVFIAYLRKKIDLDGEAKLIHTIRGRGFMLSENGE